ncbi:hypothetical protein M407DRAFT_247003 [Tulasnella calospora MUT 4182]|uniref:Uncharacterized protein n=1 Tax=Tulasnella calospora MUT 4182 TaxID=1051891 RepID=A0A0C3Q230_9AGAM|nr:hypothetical protein M407DRAFT_247003 [Tulasnella calospora MUT 4182]
MICVPSDHKKLLLSSVCDIAPLGSFSITSQLPKRFLGVAPATFSSFIVFNDSTKQ